MEDQLPPNWRSARAAEMWLSNPQNRMSLPKNSQVADADGDGLLDKTEFQSLFDLDGDGKVDGNDAKLAMKKFVNYMTDQNSGVTAGTYTAGLLLGLRRG